MTSPSLVAELAPFVPEFIKRRLARNARLLTAPLVERWRGAALVADVSGFTALAERLAEQGAVGAERLTEMLNTFFGRAIERIESHGGDVARFAGDALLVIWPCESESELAQAARRAAACALDLQAPPSSSLAQESPGAPAETALTMKVAVGAGALAVLHLGGVMNRWDFLICGAAFHQAFAALRQTPANQTTASPEAWELLQEVFQGEPLTGGVMRITDGPREPLGPPLATTPVTPEMAEALRSYLPPTVMDRVSAGHERWLGELRAATVLFISLPELNHATPLDRAQNIMQYLQRELDRYEGAVNKLNVDEKGAALVAAFGLPPLAHEDDARRGVAAALAIQRRLRALGVDGSVGVTTGRVYSGAFGGERRREYTLLGDVVNRAARLMQTAAGDILCDDETRQGAERHFHFETLPKVSLKGKAAPLAVFRPLAARGKPAAPHGELVGRDAEVDRWRREVETTMERRAARVLILEGEAGVGKSRLLNEWLRLAEAQGPGTLTGHADALETASLYFAWRPVFERFFEIDATLPPGEARRRIDDRLRAVPERAEWAPLLRSVLPVDWPDNDLTSRMAGRVRGENTRRLLVELLEVEARRRPLIVALDDAHWFDSASWELAEMVSRAAAPLLLVLATRPVAPPPPMAFTRLAASPLTARVSLAPLSPEDAVRLACRRLGVESLPRRVRDFIHRRAEGNPLFTEEMAYALRDAGQLEIVEGKCRLAEGVHELDELNFPDTLHGVITSRLDRLAPPEQLTVKVASVIGRHFPYRALHDVYPVEPDRPRLRDHLGAALRTHLVEVEAPEPDPTYLFRHVIAQEAAYNLLLFHQREQLHRAVAQWRESIEREVPPQAYATIAHHWRNAREPARAVDYLEKAGQYALEGGAYQEAIRFFREALELDGLENLQTPATRLAHWERRLGEACLGLGRLAESRDRLLRSLTLHDHAAPRTRLGLAASLLGHLAAQNLHRGPIPSGSNDSARREESLEVARAYESLAEIYYLSNEKAPLVHALVANLHFAKRAGPSPELARAYANNSISAGLAGLHSLGRKYAERAKSIGRAVDDPAALAWVYEVTGLYALGVGDAAAVLGELEEASAICRRLGDWRRWGESMATLAQACYYCGQTQRGHDTWAELHRAAAARGDELQQAWGLNGMAEGLLRLHGQRAADPAIDHLSEAMALYGRNTDRISQLGAWGLSAWAHVHRDAYDDVLQDVLAGLQLADDLGAPTGHYALAGYANLARASLWLWEYGPESAARDHARIAARARRHLDRYARAFPIGRPAAHWGRGTAAWLLGRHDRAVRHWRQAVACAQALHMPYSEALARQELIRRLPENDPRREEHLHAEREFKDPRLP